jgi:hypothetical protein
MAIARRALRAVALPKAVPPLAARLAEQPPMSDDGKMLASILARIGDEAAGKAVVVWLRKGDGDATAFIQFLGPRPKDPELLAAWASALDPAVSFRNEKNREAIRAYLAPPEILHGLPNGSFEKGTLRGFTIEGDGQAIKGWRNVIPTERQYMAFLNTMENPRDGRASLTTDAFEVPAGMKSFLFDYDFVASALFHPVSEVLEVRILTDTTTVHDNELFSDVILDGSNGPISGFDRGTGFRTTGISVEQWAGSGKPIRVKFVLKGRGALPEHIPGMNSDDHNPMGSGNGGTGLFLDNLRLSAGRDTELPPLPAEGVSIVSNGVVAKIETAAGALPPGSTVFIWEVASGKLNAVDLGVDDKVTFTVPFGSDDVWSLHFLVSYATAAANGEGRMFSPQIHLDVDR